MSTEMNMSNGYDSASFGIAMTQKQADYVIKKLKAYSENEGLDYDENPANRLDINELFYDVGVVNFLISKTTSFKALGKFIQEVIRKFDLPPVGFTYLTHCACCEEPFSGGAVFISANEFCSADTRYWLNTMFKEAGFEGWLS